MKAKILLFTSCLFLMVLCAFQCESSKKINNKQVKMQNLDNHKMAVQFDKYLISINDNYNYSKEENPLFIVINSKDGSTLLTYSNDINDINKPVYRNLDDIKTVYKNQYKIKEVGKGELWVASNNVDGSYRDTEGEVFFIIENNIKKILQITFHSKNNKEVIDLLKTIELQKK